MATGHVYILINATMPGYLKIGMTVRTPEERAAELSAVSGIPVPFSVAYAEETPDCALAETLIHSRLDRFRTNQAREFFHLPLRDAIRELAQIAAEVIRLTPPLASKTESNPPPSPSDHLNLGGFIGWQRIGKYWFQAGTRL